MMWQRMVIGMVLAALPSSSSYKLHNYGFGNGGTAGSSSSSYSLNGTAGEQSRVKAGSTNDANLGGNNSAQQANVPIITITNPSSYYNKLKIVIDTQNNPSDTLFAVAISTDNFTTTQFVKSDNTVTSSLTYPTDYRTFASWGSGAGTLVIGLASSTTYYVKAKAMQGKYTETGYGPVSSVATASPQLSFALTTSSQPSPPFSINFGSLLAATVTNAPDTINLALSTNGEQGGTVYLSDTNSGLKSTVYPSAAIASASADLASAQRGFGAQVTSATQSSGGPFAALSPYNGASANVGITSTTIRQILASTAPVTSGAATILLKAKAAATDAAATDYSDKVTLLAAASF
jgi:hypothetical protein